MQNLEYKAELRDFDLARTVCRALGAQHLGDFTQIDTYYKSAEGRFKRRETPGKPDEYILYRRSDRARPKISRYAIFSTEEAAARFGTLGPEAWVTVRKARSAYLLDNVRVHLDRVERVGDFLEFEALVTPSRNLRACHVKLAQLRRDFSPTLGEAVSCGYAELIAALDEA